MAKVYRLGPVSFPYAGRPGDVLRGAAAGFMLCGLAGAHMAIRWGWAAYGLEGQAAGATVEETWGPYWPGTAALGATAGAPLGAFIVFVAGAAWEERGSAAGVIVAGAMCGAFLAGVWGADLARRRIVIVRADLTSGPPAPSAWKPNFTVGSAHLVVTGTVERKVNAPLLAFFVAGGALVGALAGRGLAGPLPAGERFAGPAEGSFLVTPRVDAPTGVIAAAPVPAAPNPTPRAAAPPLRP